MYICIDKKLSEEHAALTIKITEDLAGAHPISALILKKKWEGTQRAALEALIQQETRYQKRIHLKNAGDEPGTFSLFHISYPAVHETITTLVSAGCRLVLDSKQIVCDLYGRDTLYFLVEQGQEKPFITGRIQNKGGDFDLRECSFICGGPPHLYIKGISLKFLSTTISWKAMKMAFSQPSLLSMDLIRGEETPDDPLSPQIKYIGNTHEQALLASQPMPLLVLKDRSGAFADLWMQYEHTQNALPLHDNASKNDPKRIPAAELAWEKDLLETGFQKKIVGQSHYYCPLDKVAKSLSFLLEIGWQIQDYQGRQVLLSTKSDFSISTVGQKLKLNGKLCFQSYEADLSSVVGAFNRKDRFVELGEGVIGLLPNSDQIGLVPFLEEGELVGNALQLPLHQIGAAVNLWKEEPSVTMDYNVKDLKEKLSSLQGLPARLPGKAFHGNLRPYQQEGVNWLSFLYEYGFHGLLADDMGLGKTVQTLAFLSRLEPSAKTLIIVPLSLLFNWKREIETFLPGQDVLLYHGSERNPALLPNSSFIITSYTTFRIDISFFQEIEFTCVILDEAQAIKNASTQTAQAICKLKSQLRISITGTPVENHLGELWSHFKFLMPGLLGSEATFQADRQAITIDNRYLQKLKNKIKPFILRRSKEEAAKDLPEKMEQVVYVQMEEAHRQVYEHFLKGIKGNLFKKVTADGVSKHRIEIFEALLRLRQICCHPLLVSGQLDEGLPLTSSKLDILLEDVETIVEEGRKVLIYSQFTSMLALLAKAVEKKGWNFAYLDGTTKDREKAVDHFQKNPQVSLFLISLKAGGMGLNLTAADYVFLYDPWWNEAVERQAIDRAHRIGRKGPVIAKRYICAESIEEKIMKLKQRKSALVADLLNSELDSLALTLDDFRFLIEG